MQQHQPSRNQATPGKNDPHHVDTPDPESKLFLERMHEAERVKANRLSGVRSVLVVLSSFGMVYDKESLRQKITLAYPDATVYFRTTDGKAIGPANSGHVDLLIDLTGPGQRAPFLLPRKLRGIARIAIGRNAGLWRANVYDKIFDEKKDKNVPKERLERERYVQKHVLAMAGVAIFPTGDTHPDLGKSIALGLPPMAKL